MTRFKWLRGLTVDPDKSAVQNARLLLRWALPLVRRLRFVIAGALTLFMIVVASGAAAFVLTRPSTVTFKALDSTYADEAHPEVAPIHRAAQTETGADIPLGGEKAGSVLLASTAAGLCPEHAYCNSTTSYTSYVKFEVKGLAAGQFVKKAVMRLKITDSSASGGSVYAVSGPSWQGDTVSWKTQPGFSHPPLATIGAVHKGSWVSVELPKEAIRGNGLYSFAIAGDSQDIAGYGGHTSAYVPQLVIEPADDKLVHDASAASYITISPADDAQARIDSAAPGATFLFTAGVHRLAQLIPRSGDTYRGEAGAVLSGAVQLTFTQADAGRWAAVVPSGYASLDGANDSRRLFRDNRPLDLADSLATLAKDQWFLDAAAGKLYIAADPAQSTFELPMAPYAFSSESAVSVTLANVTIEKYASPAASGCVVAGRQWVIYEVVVHGCQGYGLLLSGAKATVTRSRFSYNGLSGILAEGPETTLEGNTVGYNGTGGLRPGWEASGVIVRQADKSVLKGNDIHDNTGAGIFTRSAADVRFDGNILSHNGLEGLVQQGGERSVVSNNYIFRNGSQAAGWLYGAGLAFANANGAEVYGNKLSKNANGIVGLCMHDVSPPLENLYVHDNTFEDTGQTGVGQDYDCGLTNSTSLTFEAGTYRGSNRWYWAETPQTWQQWQQASRDTAGNAAEN